jgi:site-specific recombinase XerD
MIEILEKYQNYLLARNLSLVYKNFIKKFLEYCTAEHVEYQTITQQTITDFFNKNTYASNSKNNFIKAGRSFYSFLGIAKEQNEWFKIKMLKVERKLPEYLMLDDIQKAIKYITTYNSRLDSTKIETVLYFMFYTGIRKSELLNLKRASFDLTNCAVKIYEQKTKQEKIIYYPEKLRDKIQSYFNTSQEKENSFNITLGEINYLFGEIISKHLGKKIKPHLTRHGGARYMLEKGVPATIVQKILGHQSLNTTLIYLSPDQKMIERIYKEKIK